MEKGAQEYHCLPHLLLEPFVECTWTSAPITQLWNSEIGTCAALTGHSSAPSCQQQSKLLFWLMV